MSSNSRALKFTGISLLIILLLIIGIFYENKEKEEVENTVDNETIVEQGDVFKIIASSENADAAQILTEFAKKKDINIKIEYAGTLDIMDKLNSGAEYDAVWASNSIWLYMIDSEKVTITDSKSISINPVVFAIKKSKAEELGFVGRDITTSEIVQAIQNGSLKFTMSNPTQTNTGASAYLGFLSTMSGNPEVLREEHLQNEDLKQNLVSLFSGMERSSGSENFLEDLFINGNGSYEAVVTYEMSIINMNKRLINSGKEELYALYPIDGVSISDSPFAYIDNKDSGKKEIFKEIQNYLLSDDGQKELASLGRRTWFGGVNENVDKNIFNPDWGIDTTKYIVPIKFPNTDIIKQSLELYQNELRKPLHTVFCLDYSGSMKGDGYDQLIDAMKYILTASLAREDLLQFTEKDKITVIPFSTNVIDVWSTQNGVYTDSLKEKILDLSPSGSTNIYDTAIKALEILNKEDLNTYNVSVILMTDGASNRGSYTTLKNYYKSLNKQIPIYSIMFGEAYENELKNISELTNAKVFDGKSDLKKAFKEVRGYN